MSSPPMQSETSLRPETAVALSPRETSAVGKAATDRLTIQNASRGHSRKKKKPVHVFMKWIVSVQDHVLSVCALPSCCREGFTYSKGPG